MNQGFQRYMLPVCLNNKENESHPGRFHSKCDSDSSLVRSLFICGSIPVFFSHISLYRSTGNKYKTNEISTEIEFPLPIYLYYTLLTLFILSLKEKEQ